MPNEAQRDRKEYNKAWYQANKERLKKKQRTYYRANREQVLKQARIYNRTHRDAIKTRNQRVRLTALTHYSNGQPQCAHCRITDIDVLTIDHINNDGAEHRREIGLAGTAGTDFYYWLRRNNYPEGFQVLCWNCNYKKYLKTRTCNA